ncbi:hypothetical protein OSB04_023171 [Centaurea solstitialis]|uniref:DUF4378 domain-containing protein n=1 Tax=Centaurea solstitialis TaxID=347529 RepID=A0AA38SIL7_9ASTR|nr:hypothetical protein OSB04_023171 [Centaurea solstitialis]
MMTGLMQDQNLEKQIEKQIGCMSGFLHIFDRQQILAGKRIYATKRLPSSAGVTASPESVKSGHTTPIREMAKAAQPALPSPVTVAKPESPDRFQPSPAAANSNSFSTVTPPKSPLPLPIFELKDGGMKSSWKFCKEMPRLSLDSRATVNSNGSLSAKEIKRDNGGGNSSIDEKQRRSPSVIARLMGLDQLPSSESPSSPETVKTPELRRSASESRVSRDLFHSRFVDGANFNTKQTNLNPNLNQTNNQPPETNLNNINNNRNTQSTRGEDSSMKYGSRNPKNESPRTSPWRSRSFFDSGDIFPEPKQTNAPTYGDSEKIMKLREIDEQSKDLETLKHILEALQLKGLLHSRRPLNNDSQHNFVYDPSYPSDDPNVVLMKPVRSPASIRRCRNEYGRANRFSSESLPSESPRKERGVLDRNGRSPVRARNSMNSNTIAKRKPLSIETQRSFNESSESRRSSPINSPKLTPRRTGSGSDPQYVTNRSPRSRKPADVVYSKEKVSRNFVMEDESSYFSESSGSTTSQSDPERSKMEEYREGKSLLQRCDKLLNSIAEMNSITESHMSSNSVLPSPVSVLDSAFDKDESSSPSPVMKRSIHFKDLTVDLEDEIWSSVISPVLSAKDDDFNDFISNDSDFAYISDIIRASKYLPDDSGVFLLLEKQRYVNGNDTSKVSKLQRKLIFDIVAEIVDKNRQLPPWNPISLNESTNSVKHVCSEFRKVRDREQPAEDNLLELICSVLKRDLAGNSGWGDDRPVETSEAVLYIERLIFKDLVSDTILDLAELAGKNRFLAPRRKLVF